MTFDSATLAAIGTAGLAVSGAAWRGVKAFNAYVSSEAQARMAERGTMEKEFEGKLAEAETRFRDELARSQVAQAAAQGASDARIAKLETSLRGIRAVLYGACVDLAAFPGTESVRDRLKRAADEL